MHAQPCRCLRLSHDSAMADPAYNVLLDGGPNVKHVKKLTEGEETFICKCIQLVRCAPTEGSGDGDLASGIAVLVVQTGIFEESHLSRPSNQTDQLYYWRLHDIYFLQAI